MAQDKTFKLRLDAQDLQRWRREARGKPLAEWIREKCNRVDIAAVDAVMVQAEVIEEPSGEVYIPAEQPPAVSKRPAECSHHKEKGSLCFKCDPRWGFPVIHD